MNKIFNKNAKVEQLTKIFLSRGEEKGLIVKGPFPVFQISPKLSFCMLHHICLQSILTKFWATFSSLYHTG